MAPSPPQSADQDRPPVLGCVSFLNARPLIDGLDDRPDLEVRYDVPSKLLDDLTAGSVDLALCPVVDYQLSGDPLRIVPVGGIGCDGPTLTVRLFSRVPWKDVTTLYADTDSHTSVVLAQLILRERFGSQPTVKSLDRAAAPDELPDTVLLIGDKVVTNAPSAGAYAHELDLGEQWKHMTGRPFVFAIWMARPDATLGVAPELLDAQRRINASRIDAIVASHAARAGWPDALAAKYLGQLLRYETSSAELDAIAHFYRLAHDHGLIHRNRPLDTVDRSAQARPTS